MVELRKRKAPDNVSAPPVKKATSVKSAASSASAANGAGKAPQIKAGDTLTLDGFGGEVETNDGEKTTLKALIEKSEAGVVVFTYPKASTPGCTTQACLFRDEFTPLTATGFSIYGLSSDSPKSNTTFKTKQSLPYTLLCDPALNLIGAIGFKKAPKGTTRGVFVIDKQAKVLGAEAGGPAATVEVVRKLLTGKGTQVPDTDPSAAHEEAAEGSNIEKAVENGGLNAQNVETPVEANGTKEDVAKADVAADVADSAAKLDGGD
ncbi:hypothetical protein MMC09_005411 [Bachmanniomyces sp. S44760]|nr:hypothetical protein [Bachmanniomyces sp. S44760]